MSKNIQDLTPRSDNPLLQKLHQKRAEHEKEVKRLNDELRNARNELFVTKQRLRRELIKANKEKFETFYNQLMNLKTIELIHREEYLLQKHDLLIKLRKHEIDNSTYRTQLRPFAIKVDSSYEAVNMFYSEGIEKIFGADRNLFSMGNIHSLD